MAAVVRGERSSATPRSKTAPAFRAAPGRGRSANPQTKAPAKSTPPAQRAGLGPRLAIGVAVLVIFGGALAGLVLSHREPASAPSSSSALGRALAPLGFRLQHIEIQGASDMSKADLLRAADLATDTPIIGIGLDAIRKRVEATGWVSDVKVVRLLPDTLIIAVTPRAAAAVWQFQGRTHVVDADGRVIGGAEAARFPDLPLVVGEGAAEEAHTILPLLRQQPKLMTLIDALVRVDGRRWDLRLKDGSLIQLPAVGEDDALMQLDRLEKQQRLLSLGFERIDLRDPDAVAVRPKAVAPAAAKN